MRILVSACLLRQKCRYDGNERPCRAVLELAEEHELIPVCPECLGGLPTPRCPSEIQNDGSVLMNNGADVTAAYQKGAEKTLQICMKTGCRIAILKEKSPSCGPSLVYDGSFTGHVIKGSGITARKLRENGISVLSELETDSLHKNRS